MDELLRESPPESLPSGAELAAGRLAGGCAGSLFELGRVRHAMRQRIARSVTLDLMFKIPTFC